MVCVSLLDFIIRIIIILIVKVSSKKPEVKGKQDAEPVLTRQRKVVLDVVRSDDSHPTAAAVFEAARQAMPGISFATVYNSLRYLKQAGLVHEVAFGSGASRYDRETERHDHATCTRAPEHERECQRRTHFSRDHNRHRAQFSPTHRRLSRKNRRAVKI